MESWLEFEKRFRELAPKLTHARIDDQSGDAGESWRIAGTATNNETIKEFELLCAVAGGKLENLKFPEEILNHKDPKVRWYRLMKSNSANYQHGHVGEMSTSSGEHLGFVYGGTIQEIGVCAANLCLALHPSHPLKTKWYKTIYKDYGPQIIGGVILLLIGGVLGKWVF